MRLVNTSWESIRAATERAIAADPPQEAYYRHREWFTVWCWQGVEWREARGKLERQAIARVTTQIRAMTSGSEALTDATSETSAAFGAFAMALHLPVSVALKRIAEEGLQAEILEKAVEL
jgi:hypothetical protein